MRKRYLLSILVVILAAVPIAVYYASTGLASTTAPVNPSVGSSLSSLQNESAAEWFTYHGDLARSGFVGNFPSFNSAVLNWRSIALDGIVYAEPLIVGKNVLVATENNSLYDLDADSGRVIWRVNFGTPVSGGQLPCGDIDPSGITGTPVVDVSSGTIYVVAFVTPPHHELFAVDLSNGSVKSNAPADAPGMDPRVEQERAALGLSGGIVYVAYGGLAGDCGSYHGWVVSFKTDGAGRAAFDQSYQIPSGFAAGIWAPSGPAVDVSGELFVATGNSGSTGAFDFGNSVIKLSPDLQRLDWFAPRNWIQLNVGDTDLGSTGPILLDSGYVFQIGKDGVGYLLNASRLGGIGGEVSSKQVCGSNQGAYGGLAYAPPYLLVPCTDGIVALQVGLGSEPSFNVIWRGPNFVAGPPVVAGETAWTVDVTNGLIYALDISDGHTLFKDSIGSVTRFTSSAIGDGQIIVAANGQILAYLQNKLPQQQAHQQTLFQHWIHFEDAATLTNQRKMKTSIAPGYLEQ